MRYFVPILFILLFNGCSDTPTPQSEEEINAKQMIKRNISDAEKAKSEYLALQKKRQKESALQ